MPNPDASPEETAAAATPFPAADQSTAGSPSPGTGSSSGPPTRIGRFEVRQVLGEGAFGCVYRAFDPGLQREVAIKVPHRAGLTPVFRERFLREARATATIHHPNVCPVYEVGTDGDLPYLVMHFVHGGTLSGLLAQRRSPFPPRNGVAIVRKLALGVAAAHAKGVIHRDLKPQNVLWDEANREVLVTDFGLARIGSEAQLSRTGDILGTPAYMAPEQARGKQAEVGPLADVYSLGVILYRLLTGELPFQGTAIEVLAQAQFAEPRPPSEVRPGLDPRLDAICLKAMAKKSEDRFASAKELAGALADYLRKSSATDDTGVAPVVGEELPSQAEALSPDTAAEAKPAPPAAPTQPQEVLALPEPDAKPPGRLSRRQHIIIYFGCVGLWCLIASTASRSFWRGNEVPMGLAGYALFFWGVWLFGRGVVRRVRERLPGHRLAAAQGIGGVVGRVREWLRSRLHRDSPPADSSPDSSRWSRRQRIGLVARVLVIGIIIVALVRYAVFSGSSSSSGKYPGGSYYGEPKK